MTSLAKSSVMNRSGLKPLGRAVLLEPYEPEFKASIIQIPESYRKRGMMIEERGVVIEVGPEAWVEETLARASPGDKVMVSKWAGTVVEGPLDGKQYRMVNADDVYCAITAEASAKENAA